MYPVMYVHNFDEGNCCQEPLVFNNSTSCGLFLPFIEILLIMSSFVAFNENHLGLSSWGKKILN